MNMYVPHWHTCTRRAVMFCYIMNATAPNAYFDDKHEVVDDNDSDVYFTSFIDKCTLKTKPFHH